MGPAIINARIAMRHRILLVAGLLYLCAANIIWIRIDTRPPFWDMAGHADTALTVARDFQDNGISALLTLPKDSGSYPPLYDFVAALFYIVLGPTVDAAQLANLPAIIILGLATYGIAKSVMDPESAAFAALLVNFFPYMLWISRETLTEYWLTAMVALAIWSLIKTREFSNPKWSLIFGAVCGLGMLTKWTFVLFVGLPAAWYARKNWANAFKAAAVAAVLSAYWYVPQFATMPKFWRQVANAGRTEGDPGGLSIDGWIFYIRALEGSVLFFPLFLAFVVGLIAMLRHWRKRSAKWTPLVLGLLGTWCGLMLIPNKDPRYGVPILSVVAVITALAFEKRKTAQIALAAFLVFQHALVSFGIPQLPESVVLAHGPINPIPNDWNLYTQSYVGLWGKPRAEDWQIERALKTIAAGQARPIKVAMIPDLPRFDRDAFRFYIKLGRLPIVIERIYDTDEKALAGNDYIVTSIGKQENIASYAPHGGEINAFILGHPELFQMVDTFPLPNGETIRIYKCAR